MVSGVMQKFVKRLIYMKENNATEVEFSTFQDKLQPLLVSGSTKKLILSLIDSLFVFPILFVIILLGDLSSQKNRNDQPFRRVGQGPWIDQKMRELVDFKQLLWHQFKLDFQKKVPLFS